MESSDKNNEGQGRIEKFENATGNVVYIIPPKHGAKLSSWFSIGFLVFCTMLSIIFIAGSIFAGMFGVIIFFVFWIVAMWLVAFVRSSRIKIVISSSALQLVYVIFNKDIKDTTFLLTDIHKISYEPISSIKINKGTLTKALLMSQTVGVHEYGVFLELTDNSKIILCEKGTANERRWLHNDLTDVISRMRCDG